MHPQSSHLVVQRLSPSATFGPRRAAVIDAGDDVTLLREHHMPEPVDAAVAVDNGLTPWLTVDEEQNRIFLRRVEVRRFHHPRIELYTLADVDLEELDGCLLQ